LVYFYLNAPLRRPARNSFIVPRKGSDYEDLAGSTNLRSTAAAFGSCHSGRRFSLRPTASYATNVRGIAIKGQIAIGAAAASQVGPFLWRVANRIARLILRQHLFPHYRKKTMQPINRWTGIMFLCFALQAHDIERHLLPKCSNPEYLCGFGDVYFMLLTGAKASSALLHAFARLESPAGIGKCEFARESVRVRANRPWFTLRAPTGPYWPIPEAP
jgi:hypothetical protein